LLQGAKVPGSEMARERIGQGAKGPGSEWARERIGRFAPSEWARERKGSVPSFSVLSLWDLPLTWKTILLQGYYTVGWVI